jgi:hypothetical protein
MGFTGQSSDFYVPDLPPPAHPSLRRRAVQRYVIPSPGEGG